MTDYNHSINNIMFIISSLRKGGAERVVSELANHYSNIGIKIQILLISDDTISYKINDNVKISYLCNRVKSNNRMVNVFSRLRLIRKHVKQAKPSIVISFLSSINIYTCFSLVFSRYKFILSERSDPKYQPKGVFKRMLREYAYKLADGIVLQTKKAKQFFPKSIRKKSTVISNPIKENLPKFYKGKKQNKICSVGRLEDVKNHSMLIEVFYEFQKYCSDYILEIFGEGSEREYLEYLIDSYGLKGKVLLKGNVSNVHDLIKDSLFFVMTSKYEGMPNALMEAMAIGLPSISTDCGGASTLIQDRVNGLLVPNFNKVALLYAMYELASNRELRERLSKNSIKVKKEYSLKLVAQKWLSFAKEISNK